RITLGRQVGNGDVVVDRVVADDAEIDWIGAVAGRGRNASRNDAVFLIGKWFRLGLADLHLAAALRRDLVHQLADAISVGANGGYICADAARIDQLELERLGEALHHATGRTRHG